MDVLRTLELDSRSAVSRKVISKVCIAQNKPVEFSYKLIGR